MCVCVFPFHVAAGGVFQAVSSHEIWHQRCRPRYLSCQLHVRSTPNTSFISLSLHSSPLCRSFTCHLYSQRSPPPALLLSILIFYYVCQNFFFYWPSFLFCLSVVLHLFSPCSTALCLDDKLSFAGREWGPSLNCGRCVFLYTCVRVCLLRVMPILQRQRTSQKVPVLY